VLPCRGVIGSRRGAGGGPGLGAQKDIGPQGGSVGMTSLYSLADIFSLFLCHADTVSAFSSAGASAVFLLEVEEKLTINPSI
jgi:hypothetical protein